ncbi:MULTISPECIES: DUF3558 domain-containing protein [unclassified Streptomyces]|uniref:DUF3558 domain-containing protein n=1 Tax=unclassified Streptomyces TaxID=2593676 RepID=UPI002365CA76|nr:MULTISPECIES: DUF3558 domain-containing protein [unclassified Streptomyces]MDF3141961.1 DUF3558 domain-containing protein [Streptomyces sp. T21Q-yed]WDF40332.1 DUF3558 domain-containing protein [Streptomyces sp. T12]
MQRKAYVSGVAALLAALLAGCTGSSDSGGTTDDANPGDSGTATAVAEPGRYRTLPDPCDVVGEETLDSLLPGVQELTDEEQREKAYEGTPTLTFDTDRKVGCRWKVESAEATDHLFVDFERVVSYDGAVSDDTEAQELFATQQEAADLPEPTSSETGGGDEGTSTTEPSGSPSPSSSPSTSASGSASGSGSASSSASPSGSGSGSTDGTIPEELQPRVLEDLGDEAFLDDELSSSGSTAQQRTVTVVFRTSNVIVRIEYEEQPTTVGTVPDSEEMQDRAQKLAARLADALSE